MIYIKENAEPGTIYQIHATDSENVTRGIKVSLIKRIIDNSTRSRRWYKIS